MGALQHVWTFSRLTSLGGVGLPHFAATSWLSIFIFPAACLRRAWGPRANSQFQLFTLFFLALSFLLIYRRAYGKNNSSKRTSLCGVLKETGVSWVRVVYFSCRPALFVRDLRIIQLLRWTHTFSLYEALFVCLLVSVYHWLFVGLSLFTIVFCLFVSLHQCLFVCLLYSWKAVWNLVLFACFCAKQYSCRKYLAFCEKSAYNQCTISIHSVWFWLDTYPSNVSSQYIWPRQRLDSTWFTPRF